MMSVELSPANEPVVDASAGVSGDRRMLRGVLGYCVVTAIAFLAVCVGWNIAIEKLHARPTIPDPFFSKIEAMAGYSKTVPVDTVFIGSSRFFHGVDPLAFDLETAKRGLPTHSYNLGFDALDFPELRFVVEHLLADPRIHLKNLFIEPSLRSRLAPGLENSQRAVTLHDVAGSTYIANFILKGNHDWKRKLFWIYGQSQVSLTRLSNVGALTNAYIRPQEPVEVTSALVGKTGNGYIGLDPGVLMGHAVTLQNLTTLESDQKSAEDNGTARTLNDFEIAQLKDLQTLAADHGVRLMLLAHPTATPETFGEFSAVARAERQGRLDIPLTSFADPVTFFDLYQPGGFVDPDHINSAVAEKVSIKTADAFAAEIKAEKQASQMNSGDIHAVH